MYSLYVKTIDFIVILNLVIYLIYLIAWQLNFATLPIDEGGPSAIQTVIFCTLFPGVALFFSWFGKNYDLRKIENNYVMKGYHKGTEIFSNFLAFVLCVMCCVLYLKSFLPAFKFM